MDDWDTLQPHGGGEIQLIFGYGSTRFDHLCDGTVFRGIICDECAAKIVPRLFVVTDTKYPHTGDLSQYNTELPR